ncbi:MAG TPA: hypothetical protein VEQ59_01360 [Polyangiaceae bacterium]|nr:hypothetical protein [Polyangiaceae bacterium]
MKAGLCCALLLLGCAEGAAPVVAQEAPSAHRDLQALRSNHARLLKELADAPAPHVESCTSTSGDCLMQVGEGRSRLVSSLRLNSCDVSLDFTAKSSCIISQLEGPSQSKALGDYLSLENWCFTQLSACTVAKAEEARRATLEARFAARQQELEAAAAVRLAKNAVQLTRARIEYLRSTLPPNINACEPAESAEACNASVEASRQTLEATLRRDEYDLKAATSDYVALEKKADSCGRPELDCLSSALKPYGVVPESRKWIDRNLELLSKRQELLAQTSEATKTHCVAASQQQHQAGIVSAYVAYAHEPVLFFRTQLDKSFLALHQAQVSCLAAGPKTAPLKQTLTATR